MNSCNRGNTTYTFNNQFCKACYYTDVNKYSSCRIKPTFFFFSVINNYISFVKTNLPKLPKTTLKYKNLFCQTSKNRDYYTRVFTVIIYRESGWAVRNQLFIKISAYLSDLTCQVETESFPSWQLKVLTKLSNWSNLIQSFIVITKRSRRTLNLTLELPWQQLP